MICSWFGFMTWKIVFWMYDFVLIIFWFCFAYFVDFVFVFFRRRRHNKVIKKIENSKKNIKKIQFL